MRIKLLFHYISNSFLATIVRAFLTLALVKCVSVFGGVGALSALGNIQNILAIGASVTTLSTQSGVSSRLASGVDKDALKHAFHITIFGILCLFCVIIIFYLLSFSHHFSMHWVLFLLTSLGLGVNALVAAALVAYQKLAQLAFMYLISGLVTVLWILLFGSYTPTDFGFGICLGSWLGTLVGFLYMPNITLDFNIRVALMPKYLGLLKYGCASLVSVLTINIVALIARNTILASGDKFSGDLLEVGLRLNNLLDMFIIVPIATVMIAMVSKERASSAGLTKIYFYGLVASAILSLLAAIFLYFAGDFVVSVLFSEDLKGILGYLHLIMGVQFIRCLAAAAILKLLIDGNIAVTIFNDILYLGAFCLFINLIPYPDGSLILVYTSLLCAVAAYAVLPLFYLLKSIDPRLGKS